MALKTTPAQTCRRSEASPGYAESYPLIVEAISRLKITSLWGRKKKRFQLVRCAWLGIEYVEHLEAHLRSSFPLLA